MSLTEPNYRLSRQSPEPGDNRLIGVELTAISPDGRREELAMFSTSIDLVGAGSSRYQSYRPEIQVTLHLAEGDRQGTIRL